MTTRRRVLQAAAIQGLAGGLGAAFARPDAGGPPRRDTAHDPPPVQADERIARLLAPIRDAHRVTGLVGAVLSGGRLSVGAVGVRKLGSPEPIRVTDRMHLGSNTKAMTATLLGTLVDEGTLSWGSTIREVFPDLAPQLHPGYRAVTLHQLLTHRAGMPGNHGENPTEREVARLQALARAAFAGRTRTEQRRLFLGAVMKDPPKTKPGTAFDYSNHGYMGAASVAEQVTGQSWETLIRRRLFEPLGMSSAGFGPPGEQGEVDEPRGHFRVNGQLRPTHEDPFIVPLAWPAGGVHCSVPDWSRFVALHLAGARGQGRLLKPATFRVLQTPPPGSGYACGWIVLERVVAAGRVLYHDGTNRAWYASMFLAPALDYALLVATNQGDEDGILAVNKAADALAWSSDLPADVFAPPRTP